MTLALIAGTGGLPPHLAGALVRAGEVPVVCEMEGVASAVDPALPRLSFRLETLGTFLATLAEIGVTRVCMAGAMRRPPIDPALIDARTAPLVERLTDGLAKGDDGTLRTFVALFEERGIEVVGAAAIAPDLLPAEGVLTRAAPPPLGPSVAVAREALAEMGRADLGQALVVRGTEVIAREDDRGTDAMLRDLAGPEGADMPVEDFGDFFRRVLDTGRVVAAEIGGQNPARALFPAAAGVLFKAPKPGQDRRVDLPTIGPETAEGAARARLAGIVIEAGGVIVLDRPALVAALDARNMFLQVHGGLIP